ncbi:hypothetical protein BJX68DRAFT_250614 [Aspergillus pseudodeflectus]|uniref:Uncharacterized protein n=1 Tax=Aspergillus pseudodeflectus TaxID=176178 RepID=A0ABR4J8V4_9EURO
MNVERYRADDDVSERHESSLFLSILLIVLRMLPLTMLECCQRRKKVRIRAKALAVSSIIGLWIAFVDCCVLCFAHVSGPMEQELGQSFASRDYLYKDTSAAIERARRSRDC